MSEHLEKIYQPKDLESKWYQIWEEQHFFKASGKGAPFCLVIPPPNVTGSLHMGHAFEATLMDALTRYMRMNGHKTLWQVGMDHAGIATQMVVERQLQQEGVSRHDLGREEFIERVWAWKTTSGQTIGQQLRRMGASVDWSRERFTMDEGLSAAVQKVFITLYNEGLIYRGKRLVNWDPVLLTAISDLETVSTEEQGSLWHIRYPLEANPTQSIIVATTRPETLFGDVAVAVHPEDPRYQSLIGQNVILPLSGRSVPIIADLHVEREFGTGCLKITPAHDFNDYTIGERHGLTPINIFTPKAALNEHVPKAYQGLDRFEARKQVVADLEQHELLVKTCPHSMMIPRGDRSGAVIEPYLTDQWYVKVDALAKPAIKAVETGKIRFIPKNWENTYFAWMRELEDWCISRQLWWGHRIPAWYDTKGHIYVAENEQAVRDKYKLSADIILTQDEDVLDTWFSSALWPFSSLGWPDNTAEMKAFYPNTVLITGFDIIFFWVARMIMFGLKFTDSIPFKDIYIHGLIYDEQGQKMSKSKGNVIDPLDLIDGIDLDSLIKKRTNALMQPQHAKQITQATRKQFPNGINAYGTDALRMTFASLAGSGRKIQFDMGRLEGYRNFCNKIWNAARYVFMQVDISNTELGDEPIELSPADRWIQSMLQRTIAEIHAHFSQYRFDQIAQHLYEFIWHEYCDWYLELSKPILFSKSSKPALLRGTRQVLIDVLETLLRLLHPIMPYITEEIWHQLAPFKDKIEPSIMLTTYPKVNKDFQDPAAEADIAWVKNIITSLRTIRAQMNIAPKIPIPILLRHGVSLDKERIETHQNWLKTLVNIDTITWLQAQDEIPAATTVLVDKLEILVPLQDLIDIDAEKARLNKAIAKAEKILTQSSRKLDNPDYVAKAPAAVVSTEKQRVLEAKAQIQTLSQKRAQLEKITK